MLIINDGSTIPHWGTKDPNADIWIAFRPRGLQEGETIDSYSFLINGVDVVNQGDDVDGLIYEDMGIRDDLYPAIRISGGTVDAEYTITLRYSTAYIPSDDKSFKLTVNDT